MKTINTILLQIGLLLILSESVLSVPLRRYAAGATPQAIQGTIDTFFADMGGVDNGSGNSFPTGRRFLDLGLVDHASAEPNSFPEDFFKLSRGATLDHGCDLAANLRVSAASFNPTNTATHFVNVNPAYSGQFIGYNSQRLLGISGAGAKCTAIDVTFNIPGTSLPATVKGFGIVFTDVDNAISTRIVVKYYNYRGVQISSAIPLAAPSGLSFVSASGTLDPNDQIARVRILPGNHSLGQSSVDDASTEVAAISAMFLGEPRAGTFQSGDFDGDGSSDSAIFRPATAQWFTLNSGSNTVSIDQWGTNGDIPVDGDFDGDSRADFCIFRPSNGQWWLRRSSSGSMLAATFGQTGDKPVVGDYDKDGKSDMAIWRPSDGNYYVLRSSTNFSTYYAYPFGQNGDIPVQGAAQ